MPSTCRGPVLPCTHVAACRFAALLVVMASFAFGCQHRRKHTPVPPVPGLTLNVSNLAFAFNQGDTGPGSAQLVFTKTPAGALRWKASIQIWPQTVPAWPLNPAPVTLSAMPIDPATVTAANVVLLAAGGDGDFSNGNETVIVSTALNLTDPTHLVIDLSSISLAADSYRVTLKSGLQSIYGIALDGEFSGSSYPSGDGAPGGDFVNYFNIQ